MNALEKAIGEMWSAAPEIHNQLRQADTLEAARVGVTNYLELRKREMRSASNDIHPMEWIVVDDCIDVLRNIFSPRYEKMAQFSALELLWQLARRGKDQSPPLVHPGFVEEFRHLFLGIAGRSGLYSAERSSKVAMLEGREAAIARSDELDALAANVLAKIAKHPCGLDEPLLSEHRKNIARIKKLFKVTDEKWNDWNWQLRNVIHDRKLLGHIIPMTREERRAVDLATEKHVPFGITPYYAALISHKPTKSGIFSTRAQVVPPLEYVENMVKFKGTEGYTCDFMLERDTSPIDLITRRYPMIAILKPYNACFQICVYCQRNWEVTGTAVERDLFARDKVDAGLNWIEKRTGIREVLVTGGDPLVLTDYQIAYILDRLDGMDHVERIRIGTRTPVVAPMRLNAGLVDLLARYHKPPRKELIVVTHFQHSAEVTPEAMQAAQALATRGIKLYNQTVFTTANSRRFEICALRLALRRIGVDPYYLFNAKAKKEIPGYGVPIARLQQEFKEEARLLPGTVRTDIPVYNIPRLGKNYITSWQHHRLIMILPDGRRLYEFDPWEKGISLTDVFVESDESIYDFLENMKKMGEDPGDYKSIWYYF